jgi:predicted ferric reductase
MKIYRSSGELRRVDKKGSQISSDLVQGSFAGRCRDRRSTATTSDAATVATQGCFSGFEGLSKGVAQPALWILPALFAIALIRKFPYHIFAFMYRLVPVVFLVLVFHLVVFMKTAYWTQAISVLTMLVFVLSVVAVLVASF